MHVHNLMEDLVYESLDIVLEGIEGSCSCERCKNDIVAITLNKLPPKYVATDIGLILSKAQNLSSQLNTDILRILTDATEIVKRNPRHE